MDITRDVRVTVTIRSEELLRCIVRAISPDASASDGKQRTLYLALSYLVGVSDIDAVKTANSVARDRGLPTIRVEEFRKWLPGVLSQAFLYVVKGEGQLSN